MKITRSDIKEHIMLMIKESIKFAIIAMLIYFSIGLLIVYVSIEFLKIDPVVAGVITGVICPIIIIIVDHKKTHIINKIIKSKKKLAEKLLQ